MACLRASSYKLRATSFELRLLAVDDCADDQKGFAGDGFLGERRIGRVEGLVFLAGEKTYEGTSYELQVPGFGLRASS